MGGARQVWHCERQYRPVARGAGHINCGVRCVNNGGAAGLYSQTSIVVAIRIGRVVDGYAIRSNIDVSTSKAHARGVSGVDGVNAACAGRDDDIDTLQKLEVDEGVAESGIDVDAARWIRLIGVAGDGG